MIDLPRLVCVATVALGSIVATVESAQAQRETRLLPGAAARTPIQIQSENLEFVEKDKAMQIVYSGGVLARQGDSTLKASVLTIFLSGSSAELGETGKGGPSNSQIRRMEAAGPVTVTSKDQTGRGDRGIYDKAENKVHLIGNVSLSKGTQITRGGRASRLVYDLGNGHAQMVGGVHTLYTPGAGSAPAKKTASGR